MRQVFNWRNVTIFTLAKDVSSCTTLVEATEQYRAYIRIMEWCHSTSTRDIVVQHEDREWWTYHLIVSKAPRFIKGRDGSVRPRLKSVAALAEFMGWASMADPFCVGTPAIFNRGLCHKKRRRR